MLAELEQQLQAEWTRHRSMQPIEQQKIVAEAYLKRMQKAKTEADDRLLSLQEQRKQLDEQIKVQEEAVATADSKSQRAKSDALAIADRATAQLREGAAPSTAGTPGSTAGAVQDFFQALPRAISQHPEGVQTMQQILALLGNLEKAAAAEAAPSLADPAVREEDLPEDDGLPMDMDEDTIDRMAEAAFPEQEGEGEGAKTERAKKVQRARATIKAMHGVRKANTKKTSA
jgi:hypothetical protein